MTRLTIITAALLVAITPVIASAQEKPPIVFLGFTLGCDKIEAERTADESPRMTRKRAPRSDKTTKWSSTVYSGNNAFRNAETTTLVFYEDRLYGIRIRIPESPSRRPLAMFDAIRAALSKKYGSFDKAVAVSKQETMSRLTVANAKRHGMYIEVSSLSGTFAEIRAYNKTMKDRVIAETKKKIVEDDLIDIDVF